MTSKMVALAVAIGVLSACAVTMLLLVAVSDLPDRGYCVIEGDGYGV